MRKRHRIIYPVKHRLTSVFLAILMVLTSINLASLISIIPAKAEVTTTPSITVRDDAMHFYIRHWHKNEDNDTHFNQGSQDQDSSNNFYVVVEGYIVPGNGNNAPYSFYLVDQSAEASEELKEIKSTNDSTYISALNKQSGSITLNIKVLMNPDTSIDKPIEKFAGFSISAGRSAVQIESHIDEETNETVYEGITITYDEYVHLVKGHVFYNTWNKTVRGSGENSSLLFGENASPEIDTISVYTWKIRGTHYNDGEFAEHKAGDIIIDPITKKACETEDELLAALKQLLSREEGIDFDNIALERYAEFTLFYSTLAGLHTNKTLMQSADGRVFLFDLEAWYTDGFSAQMNFMIDASGSMAFAYDTPEVMNVYSILADKLGIERKNGSDNNAYYAYSYNGVSITAATPKELIEILAGNEDYAKNAAAKLTARAVSTITGTNLTDLVKKIGEVKRQRDSSPDEVYFYPKHDNLIGYYEITQNSGSDNYKNYRTWYFNSILNSGEKNVNIYRSPADYANSYDKANLNDFAKFVAQGTSENGFDFSKSKQKTLLQYNDYDSTITGWGAVPAKFDGTHGLNLCGAANVGCSGFLLNDDSTPTGKSFTLSFSVEKNTLSNGKKPEIVYVGAEEGEINKAAFRAVCEGNDLVIYHYNEQNQNQPEVISNVFSGSDIQRLTFVFNGTDNSVTVYVEDAYKGKIDNVVLDGDDGDNIIVFDPFDFKASSDDKFYVDDIFVYDTALEKSDVEKFIVANSTNKGVDDVNSGGVLWDMAFLGDEIKILLNPHNTDNTSIGVSGYSYFVTNNGIDYQPLGYWGGSKETVSGISCAKPYKGSDTILGRPYNDAGAGWYFITHGGGSDLGDLEKLGTAKRLCGLGNGEAKDSPQSKIADATADTNVPYSDSNNQSTRFYIDSAGLLRCFYGNPDNNVTCSYVYELSDSGYVRTEAAQRILGNFATRLAERSQGTYISALRYSSSQFNSNNDKLLLLDWTNDPVEVASMMSNERGDKSGKFETGKDTKNQYNFVLTGSTSLTPAVDAYNKYLLDNAKIGPKFIVIFGDGDLTDEDPTALENKFNALKKQGYTIVAVLFGSRDATLESGDKLKALVGKENDNDSKKYFFSATNLDALLDMFNTQIMAQIVNSLEGYSIKDYIDPRFDLEGENGDIWRLNAKGEVEVELAGGIFTEEKFKKLTLVQDLEAAKEENKDFTYTVVARKDEEEKLGQLKTYITFTLPTSGVTYQLGGNTTPDACTPRLCYDEYRDVYYLKWIDQIIPTSSINAEELMPVWCATIKIKAKDDFIGGNAIITNGNDEYMNYVYNPLDLPKGDQFDAEREAAEERQHAALTKAGIKALTDEGEKELKAEYEKIEKEKPGSLGVLEEYIKNNIGRYLNEENLQQYIKDNTKVASYDASSGTDDILMEYNKMEVKGEVVDNPNDPKDEYVSKGFPRTTVNVELMMIDVVPIYDVLYMGEVISPAQLLTDIEGKIITDSYYLEYLKRYAYQRYLYNEDPKGIETPLLELLNDWLQFREENETDKSFSIPYMYLPGVEYDENGIIKTKEIVDENGNKKLRATVLNCTGFSGTNRIKRDKDGSVIMDERDMVFEVDQGIEADVVGILTYRWEQREPTTSVIQSTKNFVKNDTERLRYAVTVGFTPLREGDMLNGGKWIDSKTGNVFEKEPSEDELKTGDYYFTGLNKHDDAGEDIFAGYLPIRTSDNSTKWKWRDAKFGEPRADGAFVFDREARVNGMYTSEDYYNDADELIEGGGYDGRGYIKDKDYKWKPSYKPAIYNQQLVNNIDKYTNTDDTVQLINEGQRFNGDEVIDDDSYLDDDPEVEKYPRKYKGDPRTLKGYSEYTINVVSGGIALEMKLQKGELEQLQKEAGSDGIEFTVQAARRFVDTDFVETTIKKNDGKDLIDDFGRVNYYDGDLKQSVDLDKDDPNYKHGIWTIDYKIDTDNVIAGKYGYVTVYAKAIKIKGWFGNEETSENDGWKEDWKELPVGTYEFSLVESNKLAFSNKIQFSKSLAETEESNVKESAKYFDEVVLNGLCTSNENYGGKGTKKMAQKRNSEGKLEYMTDESILPDIDGHKFSKEQQGWVNGKGEVVYKYIEKESNIAKVAEGADGADGDIVYTYDRTKKVLTDAEGNTIYTYKADGDNKGWRDADGNRVPNIYDWDIQEITEDNIDIYQTEVQQFKSENDETTTFFIGTENDCTKANEYKKDSEMAYYPPHRLGIFCLQTATVKLTIHDINGNPDNSFLYRIHGTTISGEEVDIIVSVKGGSYTTIDIVAGDYIVEEISDWSWRYEDGKIKEREGGNPIPNDAWFDEDGASVKVHLTTMTCVEADSDGNLNEAYAEIWFTHDSNGMTWVGGERSSKAKA